VNKGHICNIGICNAACYFRVKQLSTNLAQRRQSAHGEPSTQGEANLVAVRPDSMTGFLLSALMAPKSVEIFLIRDAAYNLTFKR